jgi:putative oxidoreductase
VAVNPWIERYARVAIASAFLSAVASRFGLWQGTPGLSRFDAFIDRTAQLNFFAPPAVMPLLAWAATGLETTLALALIAGVQVRAAAFGSAALLALFGSLMVVADGPKAPLDYSVFSASAAALLLATRAAAPGATR